MTIHVVGKYGKTRDSSVVVSSSGTIRTYYRPLQKLIQFEIHCKLTETWHMHQADNVDFE